MQKLNPYSKYWLSVFVFIFVALAIGIYAIESKAKINSFAAYLFFGWGLVAAIFMRQIKCSSCSTSVTYIGKFMGFNIHSGFVGRNCKKCGAGLCSK
jgi:hypothetical protein